MKRVRMPSAGARSDSRGRGRGGGGKRARCNASTAPRQRVVTEEASSTASRVRAATDLNQLRLPVHLAAGWSAAASFANVPRVSVLFDALTERLCMAIGAASEVVGCTAWLTNERVLAALARKRVVSFVVQNDDLGYRAGKTGGGRFATTRDCKRWSDKLEARYAALTGFHIDRDATVAAIDDAGDDATLRSSVACHLQTATFWARVRAVRSTKRCSNAERAWLRDALGVDTPASRARLEDGRLVAVDSVRALGVRATQQQAHAARMHHKFFVFFDAAGPYAVWTGSFNPTGFAEESLENAVLIESRDVAAAYAAEYAQALLRSAPLSWTSGVWGCRHASFTIGGDDE